ncbi:unnamed protein product [Blepharisma stoltei]|uniref:Thioredoxin domain-containing protein n=1 Tax=Blepharisma stoltei TaxID=1481888 RepID=A0AAU9K5J2_9CILI|nr:unnamed protein product [Blepharisma stoltei]
MEIDNLDTQLFAQFQLIAQDNGPQNALGGLTILFKLLKNISENPGDPKYKFIKKSNKTISSKLLNLRHISEVLTLIGYIDKDQDNYEYASRLRESLEIVLTILEVFNSELEDSLKTPEDRERERLQKESEEASKKFIESFQSERVNNALANVLGSTLKTKRGNIQTSSLKDVKFVLLYFSAHWCGPCRAFTPQLTMFYETVNANGKQLEIVFVSSDRSQEQFDEYYSTMPWAAVPYSDSAARGRAGQIYRIHGIPALILIDKSGVAKSDTCRDDVSRKGPTCLRDWERILNS